MRLSFLILFGLLTLSCTRKSLVSSSIAGRWERTETLMDPGNGSGQWRPVEASERTIISFGPDGRLTAGSHWYLSRFNRYQVISGNQLGVYSSNDSATVTYSLKDRLELSYLCREACRDRFIRVN